MSSEQRPQMDDLPPLSELQCPALALFIPYEMVKIYGQAEIQYTGFYSDARDSNGSALRYEKRYKMDVTLTFFPFVSGSGIDEVGEFRIETGADPWFPWLANQRETNRENTKVNLFNPPIQL